MTRHIMIDIETLGKGPRAAIAELGAVEFDPYGQGLGRELYHRVDLRSSVAAGGVMDAETVIWWLSQDDAARSEITADNNVPLHYALYELREMIVGANLSDDDPIVWANGASFDFPILASAYGAINMAAPWKFYNERDWRTVRKIGPRVEFERSGTHHNALDDARHQALHLQLVLKRMHQLDMPEAA